MRVLIVSGLTARGRGGVQTEYLNLVPRLIDLGTEVGFASDYPPDVPGLVHFPITYPPNFQSHIELARAIRDFTPHVVHLIGGGFQSMLMTERACVSPWIMTVHNVPPRERSGPLFIGRNKPHYAVRNLLSVPTLTAWRGFLTMSKKKLVIVHSQGVKRELVRLGYPEHRIRVIPLGSDPHPAATGSTESSAFPQNTAPKLLTIAAYSHTKGLHDLLDPMRAVLARYPNAHLVLMGAYRDGRYLRFLRKEVEHRRLSRTISIVVDAPEHVRAATLLHTDVYIQPSHEEGFCLTFIEAAEITGPIIGTDTGAIAEIAGTDRLARIVKPKDVAALENAILEHIETKASPEELDARRARLREQFSWARHAQMHRELYAELATR